MRTISRTWLHAGIGVLLCLVVVNAGITYRNIQTLHDDSRAVSHTHEALEALESVLSTLKDAETGQRGYLITGDEKFLEPYETAVAQEASAMRQVEVLTRDNPEQQQSFAELKARAGERLAQLARMVELHRQGQGDEAQEFIASGAGKALMDEVRDLVNTMRRREQVLLVQRETDDLRAYRAGQFGVLISALAGIAALFGFLLLMRSHLRSIDRSAAEAHEQRELLRATLGSIGDAVIATDTEGRVTFLNDVAQRLTGWTQSDAAGASLENVFHIVNEATRAPVENPALRALKEGRVVGLANHTILVARDGTEWPIDDSAAPITSRSGVVNGAVLVFREISERKRQEAALMEYTTAVTAANQRMSELVAELRASEGQFHTLADSIPQLAWMTRPDGYIYWYNQRWYEYTGTTPEEMAGWGWQKVQDPKELPRVMANWKRALASGEPWEDTFPLRRHDGVMRWQLSRATPWRNEKGEIGGWFGTNTDITERLEMEAALKEADRRKDEFLATLAHELRNPIAPISNALQLWPLVEQNRDEMERLRAIMERQVQQMTRLVDDLLDVSRITRGKIQLRREPVDLNEVVSAAIEAVRPLIDACEHQLILDVKPEPIVVDGDVARLTQIVGNLLQNAAKYTGRKGTIQVVVQHDEREARLTVRDNGPGIPPAMLARIFEMFEQVEQTLDRSHGGLGLGLTLVKRLVELHGGSVSAYSAGEGRGAEFTIRLPVLAEQKPALEPTTPAVKIPARVPRHRILVVDDVRASAKTLGMMLQSIGQDVAIVHDGESALRHAAEHFPDVIFLDIAMPGISGYEVAQRVRQNPDLASSKLVALTGYGHEEDRRRAIEAGFDHHLTKPTSIDQLTQLLLVLPAAGDGSPRASDRASRSVEGAQPPSGGGA